MTLSPRSRRFALLGAAGFAAVALAVSPSLVAVADENTPVLRVEYESGTVDSGVAGLGVNECCGYSIDTTTLSRNGIGAVKHEVRYGDSAADGPRAESHTETIEATHFDSGDSVYYGFSVYIPSTWVFDETSEDIVFQWHNYKDSCDFKDRGPSAFLSVHTNGQWRLRYNSDSAACSTETSVVKQAQDLGAVKPGQWNDFVFKFDWSEGADGRIQVWHQTSKALGWVKVADRQGANTYNDVPTTIGYLKWGIYKPAWRTAPSNVSTRAVFHDNIAVGSTFTAVNPEGGPRGS
ncbi:polysaccharide lyase [Glycomyces tritici]|uniref:Polysaccharide lyase n=1 Tax=Glycomyces tritici TaxID=2665176 RepID=A0ABT7YQ09_9ACTN|nr:polysaccharide lyase [Glycomyces tritici]MDN3240729.1 polysaccharide lyase [Glycomyces tritici]